ncbi:MAG: Sec-independent protein translocase protein TatB [Halorhodospira sp.]
MFDLGFWEVLIICLIGLLVLGPERMAHTVRVLGRWTGKARSSFNAARREVERELRVEEIRKAGESVRRDVEQTRRSLKGTGEDLDREVREARRSARLQRAEESEGGKRRPDGEEEDS